LIARGCAVVGFIVCLQAMTWACSARTPAAVPTPAQTDQQPNAPTAAAISPEPEPAPVIDALPRAAIDECALIAQPAEPIATIGLTDRIDPANALHPSNASERLLFGQLYETLVRLDCMGRLRPGLASSWQLDQRSGRLWIVTLRQNARFSDGTPVTAADVRASWTRGAIDGYRFRTNVSRLVDGVDVVDDRTLVIQLSPGRSALPLVLAHPDLAVAKWVTDSPMPIGTRSSRLELGRNPARGIALSELTVSRDQLPPLRFLVAAGDQRDLLDAGVDLLLTRDPATLDYAATLAHFQLVPLAWERTQVLLTPGRSPLSPSLSEDARQALADDAVRGEARGAQGPFWWEAGCDMRLSGSATQAPTARVVYDANDGAARDLAERFVGLVRASGPAATTFLDAVLPDRPRRTFQRATGLTGEDLANARRLGTDAGYVISVESRPLEPCHELQALMDRVPWLTPRTIIPLVDTRLQAVVRRGRAGITADFDGALLIDGVGAAR
jgi:Bacterial extracellular solute-binding proteins, family 5 Middle